MTHDEQFMRMLKVEPCDFSKFDVHESETRRAGDAVPASVYNALVEAYARLDAECASIYPRARRVRAAYELVLVIVGIVACVAIAVWIRFG